MEEPGCLSSCVLLEGLQPSFLRRGSKRKTFDSSVPVTVINAYQYSLFHLPGKESVMAQVREGGECSHITMLLDVMGRSR